MQIEELTIQTNSIEETSFFYNQKLGFDIVSKTDIYISFKAGRSLLKFELVNNKKPYYHFAFTIAEDNFDSSIAFIKSRNIPLLPYQGNDVITFKDWNAKSFYFHDNNGSILEYIVRYDQKYIANKAFSPSSIIEISEIGIVTPCVGTITKEIANLGIDFYTKGPKHEDFIVMGDDTGLLLVCAENRAWLPTDRKAEQHSVKVLTNKGVIQYI